MSQATFAELADLPLFWSRSFSRPPTGREPSVPPSVVPHHRYERQTSAPVDYGIDRWRKPPHNARPRNSPSSAMRATTSRGASSPSMPDSPVIDEDGALAAHRLNSRRQAGAARSDTHRIPCPVPRRAAWPKLQYGIGGGRSAMPAANTVGHEGATSFREHRPPTSSPRRPRAASSTVIMASLSARRAAPAAPDPPLEGCARCRRDSPRPARACAISTGRGHNAHDGGRNTRRMRGRQDERRHRRQDLRQLALRPPRLPAPRGDRTTGCGCCLARTSPTIFIRLGSRRQDAAQHPRLDGRRHAPPGSIRTRIQGCGDAARDPLHAGNAVPTNSTSLCPSAASVSTTRYAADPAVSSRRHPADGLGAPATPRFSRSC